MTFIDMFKRKSRYKIKPSKPRQRREEKVIPIVRAEEIEDQREAKVLVRDTPKRRRLIVLAILNSAVIVVLKLWATWEWNFMNTLLFALSLSVVDYLFILPCFQFKVKKESYFTVLPQPALFVFSSVLMLELIFFQRFERIFEGVLFSVVLAIFTVVLIVVLLSSNVLNVSLYKAIPLLQVAQTVSFVVALFVFYFSTFSFVSGGISPLIIFLTLFVIYSLITYTHLSHFSINLRTVFWYSVAIGWGAVSLLFSLLLWPVDTFMVSLVPMTAAYVGCGVVMHSARKNLTFRVIFEYLALFVVILFAVIFQATWGVGGPFWML